MNAINDCYQVGIDIKGFPNSDILFPNCENFVPKFPNLAIIERSSPMRSRRIAPDGMKRSGINQAAIAHNLFMITIVT
jgi:hypothetical protein